MTWRRIAVYYALGIMLGGYYFAFEWRPNPDKPIRGPRPLVQSRFLPLNDKDIHELILRRQDATVRCHRNGQTWETLEPPNAQVTSGLVTSLIDNLTQDKEIQVVEQSATDLKPYGLSQAYAILELKGKADNLLATVAIGDYNPTKSAVYAYKDKSKQVVVLGSTVRYYEELIFESAGFDSK